MRCRFPVCTGVFSLAVLALLLPIPSFADGDVHKVKHIIVIMQENHSFDNYFGALAYAPGSPYHSPERDRGDRDENGCREHDHTCVDGLACRVDSAGDVKCSNANLDDDGSIVFAFHDTRRRAGSGPRLDE